jgi:hypothetical protein
MLLPEVPAEVTGDQIQKVLDILGVTVALADIRHIEILPQAIRIQMLRRNADGHPMAAGEALALIEADIRIRWKK